MEEIFKLIGNFGFPIVIAVYYIFRHEKKLSDLVDLIKGRNGILDKIEEISKKIGRYKC